MRKTVKCVLVGFVAVVLLSGCSPSSWFDSTPAAYSSTASNDTVIGCAKMILEAHMNNPSSAVYNEAVVYDRDNYGRYIVYLDVSCQTTAGGYKRYKEYVCLHSVDSDGHFTYDGDWAYSQYVDTLKMMNHWNEAGE